MTILVRSARDDSLITCVFYFPNSLTGGSKIILKYAGKDATSVVDANATSEVSSTLRR